MPAELKRTTKLYQSDQDVVLTLTEQGSQQMFAVKLKDDNKLTRAEAENLANMILQVLADNPAPGAPPA